VQQGESPASRYAYFQSNQIFQIREWRLQLQMVSSEVYMHQLLHKVHEHHIANVADITGLGSSLDPCELWPADADFKGAIKGVNQRSDAAERSAKPSHHVEERSPKCPLKKSQVAHGQAPELRPGQLDDKQQQKTLRRQQRQLQQVREAKDWLLQQQGLHEHAGPGEGSSPAVVCVAATLCTQWQVISSPICSIIPNFVSPAQPPMFIRPLSHSLFSEWSVSCWVFLSSLSTSGCPICHCPFCLYPFCLYPFCLYPSLFSENIA
jgi:hypothetical protein